MNINPLDTKTGSWPFWKASIVCALIGGTLGAFLALMSL